jgi:type VI secretion system secreted protein VgrG
MSNYTQTNRPLAITTPLDPDALLVTGFSGREAISQPFQFQLDLLAENRREIPFDKVLGQAVAVRLGLGGGRQRYFHGIVSRFSEGVRDKTFTAYRAEVVPRFWLLTRRVQNRIFQQLSIPDILKKVLEGLDVSYQIGGSFHRRDYCVQYRESDFDFASRLMEEEGIYYFFTHTADGHKMVLANTPQSHPDVPEQSRVIFEEVQGGQRPDMRVSGWEKVQEVRSGKYTLWDHCFELPHKHLEADKQILESVPVGQVSHKLTVGGNDRLEIFEFPGGYAQRFAGIGRGGSEQPAELQKIYEDNTRTAAIRMQQEALPGLVIRGAGNCRQFVSGHKFTLARHFNGDGQYVLTHVEHTARLAGNYQSAGELTTAYENRFSCIPLALPYRPPRVTPRPRIAGTQTAVVVGPPGEAIFTDKYGRVKVQFHWDRQGKGDAASSCWIRVATVWAGKRFGAIHVPLVGMEVIVDFLEGDPDRPIVIGAVYNAEMMPPFPLPENKTVSGIKDRAGSNTCTIQSKEGCEYIKLEADREFQASAPNALSLQCGDSSLKMTPGEIKLESKKIFLFADEITCWAKGTITVQGALVKINC